MRPVPLAVRVLEVIADWGEDGNPRYRCGSGCLVAGRTVLTAAHVVAGATRVFVRGADKIVRQAMLDPKFIGDPAGPRPDLALLEIIDSASGMPAMSLAAVDRDSPTGDPVERCHVIGYPAFMERTADDGRRYRETADAFGHVPALSGLAGGLLSVQVSSSPRPLPDDQVVLGDSEWSGMSGAPAVADGYLLGAVTEHAARQGSSAITVTPLTALEADPAHPGWGSGVANPDEWWARLEVSGAVALQRLPTRREHGEPAYLATVREIRQRTELLTGRERELADIASFAEGSNGYVWLVGEPWAGKSSLLAEAVARLEGEVDVISYFLSRREADADSGRFLAAVVPQLGFLLGADFPTAGLHEFRALWRRAAERARREDRHLLLVVDGLDEDLRLPGLPSVAALLPAAVGGHAHVLVSSRPHPKLPLDIPVGHPLLNAQLVLVSPFPGAAELSALARQEIDDLLRRDDDGLATDVLGLLTAAAGPLEIEDLAALTVVGPASAALARRIREMVNTSAGRSLQPSALHGGADRYQFAHESLLAHARAHGDLTHPDFLSRIHEWAEDWRSAGWPPHTGGTPLYLLDSYPSALAHSPERLARLVGDLGWVEAAIISVGVDRVLADLRRAVAICPESRLLAAVLAAVTGQAYNLRPPRPVDQPCYVLRQLCLQAMEMGEDGLVDDLRRRLQARPGPRLVPAWTTRRISPSLSAVLGHHDYGAWAVTVLSDGRVVSGGEDECLRVWDPAAPGTAPVELGFHDSCVWAIAELPDGRIVSGEHDGRLRVWNADAPDAAPVELGRHPGVRAAVALADGRVVTGGVDKRVMMWDPASPGAAPVRLGRHRSQVHAACVLADGRVVTAGRDKQVLMWDPSAPGAAPVRLGRHKGEAKAVAALSDGRVVSAGYDGWVLMWDPSAPGASPVKLGFADDNWWQVGELPNGWVVVGGNWELLLWDRKDPGAAPVRLGPPESSVVAMAVLQSGQVVTCTGRQVLMWDPAVPRSDSDGWEHGDESVYAVAPLQDGRVITGSDENYRVLIWDNGVPAELGRHAGVVVAAAALSNGQAVTGGHDGQVLLWNPDAPGVAPIELGRHEQSVLAVAELPDGRVVTGGSDGRVLVWNPDAPGTRAVELGRPGIVWAIAVLGDGRVVTGGSDDGRVLIWNPSAPGATPEELGRHSDYVSTVEVLGDGRVVTGARDQRVLVWDLGVPGAYLDELAGHGSAEWDVRVAALHGSRIVTNGDSECVLLWDLTQAGSILMRLSCPVRSVITRTCDQARTYIAIADHSGHFSLWTLAD
jgi:WD40 repeat protein